MIAKAGGYNGPHFKVFRWVTQDDPLLTMIFNVVMDAIMSHWVTVVTEEEAVPEGLRRLIQCLEAYFYADDGSIVST